MNKKVFLLPLLTISLLIAGCNGAEAYNPKIPYPGIPEVTPPDDSEGGGDLPEEFNMVVYFYLDYSHSDTPIYQMDWYSLTPLRSCPEQAVLTDADAPDPLYPHFLGYSEYPSSIDEEHLWNFETDYKQSNILSLYGIWVSNS